MLINAVQMENERVNHSQALCQSCLRCALPLVRLDMCQSDGEHGIRTLGVSCKDGLTVLPVAFVTTDTDISVIICTQT